MTIVAFFAITRGEIEILPNGTERKYGKILKRYFFFWFKEKGKKKIYFIDDELAGLVQKIKQYFDESITLCGDPFTSGSITTVEAPEEILQCIPVLRKELEVYFSLESRQNGIVTLRAYEEEPIYVFPEWLRTAMAGCITCTPTVYGNIIYWTMIGCIRKDVLFHDLFGIFKNPYAGIFIVWIAYWLSLAWLNTVLWNIYDKQ